jgi:mannose-6-phosphate isomerase
MYIILIVLLIKLWIGTHPTNPSYLWSDPSKSLGGLIVPSPTTFLGPTLSAPHDQPLNPLAPPGPGPFPHSTQIPYLFKVLSIAKALPLQTHPSKELAEKLHQQDPKLFVDANHKPEIAVAVADGFRGFVGFGEHTWATKWLREVQELREAIGNDEAVEAYLKEPTKDGLKNVYASLLTRNSGDIERSIVTLVRRLERDGAKALSGDERVAEVVKLLYSQYGADVGVLAAPFFMNFVTLNRGEAVFIPADTIHAYLEGGE